MHRRSLHTIGTLFATLTLLGMLSAGVHADIPDEAKERIEHALPTGPIVAPGRPRHVLIFNLCKGFPHGCIPYGDYALKRLGEATGAYTAVVSSDVEMFQPQNLAKFDAVIFNNTTGTLFEDPALRQNLIKFVRRGKGIVGIHAATDCFYDWVEFGEMMGGYFNGHPWNEEVTLKIEEPDHPVTGPLGDTFVVADEIYQFREPYSRENLRVLVSLDTGKTNMNKKGIRRDDDDFAVSWVRDYGGGRVFYCSLGHRNEIFWNPAVLAHYLAGIQFALGDLPADAAPSAATQMAVPLDSELEGAFGDAEEYVFGESRLPLSIVEAAVFAAADSPAQRALLQSRLSALLESPKSTADGKAFACRQLSIIGDEACVPALAALLPDEDLSHMARYALQRIEAKEAETALLAALGDLDGELRIGVINSIGERGNPGNVKKLFNSAIGVDDETRAAVTAAIGKSGGPRAAVVLPQIAEAATRNNSPYVRDVAMQAMVRCAADLAAEGDRENAAKLYNLLYSEGSDAQFKIAGLRGLTKVEPLKIVPTLIMLLSSSDDETMRRSAMRFIAEMEGTHVTTVLAIQLPDLPFTAQALLVEALAERGDVTALPTIVDRIDSGNRQVRIAATKALGVLGDASVVKILAELAAGGSEEARQSLRGLRAAGVNEAMATALGAPIRGDDSAVRIELIQALGARHATGEVEALIAAARRGGGKGVGMAALAALTEVADIQHAPQLADLLLGPRRGPDAQMAARALTAACLRSSDVDGRSAAVIEALARSPMVRSTVILLAVLGELGGEPALQAVRAKYRDSSTPEIVDAALRALGNWPDDGSVGDLAAILQSDTNQAHRELAFTGYLRVVTLPSERSNEETAEMLAALTHLKPNDEMILQLLQALERVPAVRSLMTAEQYMKTRPAVARQAAEAALAISAGLAETHEREAMISVQRVLLAYPDDAQMRRKAGETVNTIERGKNYITAFKFSGPHTVDKTGADGIFELVLAPEKGEPADWISLPEESISAPGIIDLGKVTPGDNCAGYLLTEIVASEEQRARLELGSDDGIKVLLNGEVVHANMVYRGHSAGSDVIVVTLKPGVNRLLLKIIQGGGGWGASCRIRDVDGFELKDIVVREPQ